MTECYIGKSPIGKLKWFVALISSIALVCLVAGCGGYPASQAGSDAPVDTNLQYPEQDQWLQTNQLGKYDSGTQDWATIEAAAIEEGSLLVYTSSAKVNQVVDAWAELYPDITLVVNDSDDITVMMDAEQKAGNVYGDVWFSNDGAYLVGNMLPHQYAWNFIPDILARTIAPEYSDPLLIPHFTTTVVAYNSELNDTCPISNIWELTQPEWKEKVFIEDPLTDTSTLDMLLTYVYHADAIKAAYIDLYGTEPVMDEDTPDAGWLWLKRFAQNGPIPQDGGDDVNSALASPGMTDNYMAFTSYSSYADVLQGDLAFEPCWGVQPVTGIRDQNYLGIINQAPHPNAAKLFIRYITSEEGRQPWAQFGGYFPDTAYQVPEGQKTLDEILAVTWVTEEQFAYDNVIQAMDLYLLNLPVP